MKSVPMKTLFFCFFFHWHWVEIVENGDFALFINLKEHCVRMGMNISSRQIIFPKQFGVIRSWPG